MSEIYFSFSVRKIINVFFSFKKECGSDSLSIDFLSIIDILIFICK